MPSRTTEPVVVEEAVLEAPETTRPPVRQVESQRAFTLRDVGPRTQIVLHTGPERVTAGTPLHPKDGGWGICRCYGIPPVLWALGAGGDTDRVEAARQISVETHVPNHFPVGTMVSVGEVTQLGYPSYYEDINGCGVFTQEHLAMFWCGGVAGHEGH